jgi:hypothetical protein
MSYDPKVHKDGPNKLVVESGGELDVASGGSLKLDGSHVAATAAAINRATRVPPTKFSTAALENTTLAAGNITGALAVTFINTGTTPATLTTRTAAQMFADHEAAVGDTYLLFIRNGSGSANTLTVGAGTGVTLTGTMTIAQNVTRMFHVTFVSGTAVTIQNMGVFAAGA